MDGRTGSEDTIIDYWRKTGDVGGSGNDNTQALISGTVLGSNSDATGGNSIAIEDTADYAFGSSRADSELYSWDLTDKTTPSLADTLTANNANHVWLDNSNDVLYASDRDNGSLHAVDTTTPSSLSIYDTVSVSGFSDTYGVHADPSQSLAAVADRDSNGVALVDTNNITNLSVLDSITDTQLSDATQVRIDGDYAYVTASTDRRMTVIDVSTPSSLSIAGSIQDDRLDLIDGIEKRGDYVYVTTGERLTGEPTSGYQLNIIDVSTPSSPQLRGNVVSSDLERSFSVRLSGDFAYCPSYDNGHVVVIDISDPDNPSQVDTIAPEPEMWWVDVIDPYGITLSADGTLQVLGD